MYILYNLYVHAISTSWKHPLPTVDSWLTITSWTLYLHSSIRSILIVHTVLVQSCAHTGLNFFLTCSFVSLVCSLVAGLAPLASQHYVRPRLSRGTPTNRSVQIRPRLPFGTPTNRRCTCQATPSPLAHLPINKLWYMSGHAFLLAHIPIEGVHVRPRLSRGTPTNRTCKCQATPSPSAHLPINKL